MANTLTLQNGSGNLTGGLAWLAQQNSTAAQNTAKAPASNVVSDDYNRGGILGGLGYMGEKLAVGFVSSVEGIWDYAAGGIARLIGEFGSDKANKWAEEQIANDWFGDWYSHPDEWYNPSKGWKIAGDVAGGIGTSLPAMLTTAAAGALTVASGGAFSPLAGALISASVAGLGAAGRATKEAYQQTGELGGKEFGYGALVGATEGAIEGVSGLIGAGSGAAVKAISESFGRQTAKAVARQGIIKTMAKGFVGEAFEEGVAEILAPVYQRMTYDPNAQMASASEVAYAAFVGGLSGMVMGGGTATVSKASNLASGNRLATEGKTAEVMGLAGEISQFETENNTGEESFRYVSETRQKLAESLEKTDGVVKTVQQKELLGDLNRANVAAVFDPLILRSASTAAANAEVIADRLSAYGYTDANGNPVRITAEMIREGYDPKNPKSISKAIKTNNVLRTLAVLDATGRLSMDARAFEAASLEGFDMASEVDLNRYVESTDAAQRAAFSRQLGVEDISMLDAAGFNNAVAAYAENGGKQSVRRSQAIAANADAVAESDAKPMPKTLNMKEDGTVRYRDADSDIAVTRKGDTYTIYDYTTKTASFDLTRAEVNRALRQYQGKRMAASKTNASAETTTTAEPAKAATSTTQDAAELDTYARENIKDYASLSAPAKGMIRRVIRQARAKGIAETEILSAARVSAHSGVNVVFNKNACRVVDSEGKVLRNEAGEVIYSDGFYDEQSNRIVINPEGTRTQDDLLIHELDHAVRSRMRIKDWRSLERKALKGLTAQERNNILAQYAPLADGDPYLMPDEYIAHFSEKILTTGKTIDLLLQERPSLGQRIIDFFKGAETDYANDAKLSGAAKRYLKLYKKHFEAFSQRNQQNNAFAGEASGEVDTDTRFALVGRTEDGRGIYRTNYPENTPKDIKQKDIVDLVQNVWSKKPIKLNLIVYGKSVPIEARFNPNLTERSDLSKIAFGNRKGTASEKRITMNLSSDLYQIAEESHHVGSKAESGKDNAAHTGVTNWHYFLTDLVYVEADGTEIECYMNIDIKQNNSGLWFYSFAIEKGSRPADVLSVVTDKSATTSTISITENAEKSNPSDENSSKNLPRKRFSLPETDSTGAELTSGQRKYFGSSKQLDGEGRLQVMYQGAPEEFFTFDKKKSKASNLYGRGFYFTNSSDQARHYGTVRSYYLNITNPLSVTEKTISRMQIRKFLKAVAENEDYSIENYGTYDVSEVLRSVYEGKSDFAMLYDVSLTAIGDLVEAVELFNEVNGTEYDGFILDTESVIFRSEQAKLTSNTAPSNTTDVRYSLPKVSANTQKADADYLQAVKRGDMQTAKRMVEQAAREAGYDSPLLYHGSDRFGFTSVDFSKSDDRISFFLTDNINVAGSYTEANDVRQISNKAPSEKESAAHDDMLKSAKTVYSKATNIATPYGVKKGEIEGVLNGYAEAVRNGKMTVEEAQTKFRDYAEKRLKKLYAYGRRHRGGSYKYKSYYSFLNGNADAKAYRSAVNESIEKLKAYANEMGVAPGIYQMYAKTNGMLEVDGHNRNWAFIRFEYNGKTYNSTRDIAALAKAEGYSGVHFKGIVDMGGHAKSLDSSNVYIVFNGEAAKSADIVTYDDKGKIIPPSQRFNDRKNEFRYALPKQERIEQNLAAARASIVSDLDAREYKAPVREKVFNVITSAQIAFTNAQAGIEKMGKMLGVSTVDVDVESVRASRKAAEAMIGGQQYRIGKVNADGSVDYQGEGIARIYKSVRDKGGDEAVADFDTLLFAQHHVDRMTLKERTEKRLQDAEKELAPLNAEINKTKARIKKLGKKKANQAKKQELREKLKKLREQRKPLNKLVAKGAMENKPVLGVYMDENGEPIITTVDSAEVRAFTVEEAREMIDALKSKYDYFEEKAEAVWAYNRNLNQYRVDTGLITQESFDEMQWLYPHYVPTYRVDSNSGIASIEGKYNLAIKKTVKGAKGSTKRLISPEVIIARQTMETIPAGRENQLTKKLADAAERRGKNNFIEVVSTKKLTAEELADLDPTTIRPKGGQITYFKDGEMQTLRVAKEIFAGYESFASSGNSNIVYDAVTYLNGLFKKLVTSASPAFIVRNSLRDIQEAGINTHYTKTFLKNYGVAIEQYRTSGKWLREFMAFGGLNSSLFDFNKGAKGVLSDRGFEVKKQNVFKKSVQLVENANQMIEMLPRLAEYISAREAGMSPQKAILDAADVTTNFGRSGRVTRVLNRTIVPFLNPSIQGFSKMVRNVTDAFGAGSVSDVSRALGSLGLKAALVGIIPMMFNRALYEDDEDYQNLRDADKENNYLFKIGDTFIKLPRGRVASALAGLYNRTVNVAQGKKFDVLGYIENLSTQVTPVDSASRNIFSPILRDLPTNTTWYGTAIEGREFENLAPEDRYDEGTSSIAIALGKVINYSPKKIHYLLDQYTGVIGDIILPMTTKKAERGYVASAFTLDPATSNKLSESFYKVLDEYTYAKNKGDAEAALVLKYLQKTKSAVSELFDEKTAVQKGELKGAEKLAATRTIQLEINALYLKALEDLPSFRDAIKGTEDIASNPTYSTMIAAGAKQEKIDALRFAEATRIVYGEAQALQWYDKGVYEEAELLNLSGLSYYNYYEAYFRTRGLESTKDKDGNTVAGSKRDKFAAVVNAMTITPQQKLLLMASFGYKPKDGEIKGISSGAEKKLLSYITKLPGITAEQRVEILTACGFKVKNGRVVLNG